METPGVGAGCTVAISATLPTTLDDDGSTGFPAATYTAITGVTQWDPSGKTWQETTSQPLASDNPNVYKSVFDFGSSNLTYDRDDDDAGQVIVDAAVDAKVEYAVKVTYDDGSVDYFKGFVMSAVPGSMTAPGIMTKVASIRHTSDYVKVAA